MKQDNLHAGQEAQDKLIAGFNKVADAVRGTLGAAGYNGLLQHELPPFSVITNDGVSIAKSIELADPIENMGANLAKEITMRSDKEGGDGTTTAITLAQAIITEALPHLSELSPMELKRQLDECLPIIEKSIDDQKKTISPSEVKAVATISAESEEIGSLMQEIYEKIGKDGILYPDISNTYETFYTIGKGIQIKDAGLVSPYLADFNAQGQLLNAATIKNAHVLITKQKITSGSDLSKFLEGLYNRHDSVKELVIFCDEIEALAIGHFISLKVRDQRPFKAVIVKMPVLWKDWWYEDLAKMTGATVIDPIAGLTFKTATYEHLGHVESIIVDKTNTYLDGTLDVSEYIIELEHGDDDSKIRAARLNTKTARLFVGARTDTELTYKRLKVDDSRNAAFLAMKDGIVPGGGLALLNSAKNLPHTIGGAIMGKALQAPLRQIMLNAGTSLDEKQERGIGGTQGFNASTKHVEDLMEAGIVDPASVVKSSVHNALSVASTLLTTRVIVTLNPKAPEPQPMMPMI